MCTHTYISTSHRPPPPPDLLHRGWRRACPASHDPQSGCAARGYWRTSERSLSSLAQRPAAAASGFLAGGPSHSQLQPGREGLDRGRWMRQSAELVWYRFKISLEARKISRYTLLYNCNSLFKGIISRSMLSLWVCIRKCLRASVFSDSLVTLFSTWFWCPSALIGQLSQAWAGDCHCVPAVFWGGFCKHCSAEGVAEGDDCTVVTSQP